VLNEPSQADADLGSAPPAVLRESLDEALSELRAWSHGARRAEVARALRDGDGPAGSLFWIVAELGQRYARAGVLDRPDDVLHLTLDELRSLPRCGDRRPLVAARRAELEFFRTVEPPAELTASSPQ
jgi:hypothetical protein